MVRHHVSTPLAVAVATAGASAVMFGAFGAHALDGALDARQAAVWHTAVSYHFWHALALALTAVLLPAGRWRRAAAACFGGGIVLFCGSLYVLALGMPHWVGIITPFGGLAFIVGWIVLGVGMSRSAREAT